MRSGSVILTRNPGGEEFNSTPGYFNHCAIFIGEAIIIESVEGKGVIKESLNNLFSRISEYRVLEPINYEHGKFAALCAISLLGVKYRKISSIFKNLRRPGRGLNCVGLVRMSYKDALGFDPGWKIPDDLLNNQEIFNEVL